WLRVLWGPVGFEKVIPAGMTVVRVTHHVERRVDVQKITERELVAIPKEIEGNRVEVPGQDQPFPPVDSLSCLLSEESAARGIENCRLAECVLRWISKPRHVSDDRRADPGPLTVLRRFDFGPLRPEASDPVSQGRLAIQQIDC